MKKAGLFVGGFLIGIAALFLFTHRYDRPISIASFADRHGRPIGSVNAAYNGIQFFTPLKDIPPSLIQKTLVQEDRFFYWHLGLNPVSLAKALIANVQAGRVVRGGSTITQQVARNLLQEKGGGFRARNWLHKIEETALAVGLEIFHTKDWILERYLNSAYYGRRTYGITAAAGVHFGKTLATLTGSEEDLLVQLPRAPNRLAKQLKSDLSDSDLSDLSDQSDRSKPLARHYLEFLTQAGKTGLTQTTLDLDLQRTLETALPQLLQEKTTDDPALNMAAVVIEVASGDVLAMVGSRDYFDESVQGAFNHALALRQPGSALKPFTYFAAFERGFGPDTQVADLPVSYVSGEEGYAPQNFDRRFRGLVSVREALAGSLNVPAVVTLNEIGLSFYSDLLKRFGFTSFHHSPEHYGLSLTLGSGEVSLLELTNAYAALARGGKWMPYRLETTTPPGKADDVSAQARKSAGLITAILSDAQARLREFGNNENLKVEGHTVAVKTGTSYNHRDNWAVGYSPRYAVGLWVGHSDNTPMDTAATGATMAAPLWHAAMEHLLRGRAPETFAFLEKKTGLEPTPSRRPRIESESVKKSWHVTEPLPGSHYRMLAYLPREHQQIPASAVFNTSKPVTLEWFLDDSFIGETREAKTRLWLSPTPGPHELRVKDVQGYETQIPFQITETPL